jgi:hypothetical protein
MTDHTRRFILWSPRIAAIAAAAFLGIFALDSFSADRTFFAALPHFFLHLAPTFVLLGVVYVAWRRPWFGALVFLSFALAYALGSLDHPSWIAAIAGPLTLAGSLYLASWRWPLTPRRP